MYNTDLKHFSHRIQHRKLSSGVFSLLALQGAVVCDESIVYAGCRVLGEHLAQEDGCQTRHSMCHELWQRHWHWIYFARLHETVRRLLHWPVTAVNLQRWRNHSASLVLTMQPPWAYCEIIWDIRVRTRKEGRRGEYPVCTGTTVWLSDRWLSLDPRVE